MSGAHLEIPETLDANPDPDAETAPPVSGDRPLSAREKIMEGINAKRAAQMDLENAQAAIYDTEARAAGLTFDDPEPEGVPTHDPEPPKVREVITPAPKPATEIQPAAPAPQYQAPPVRTVMLDGQQYAVTDEQYAELATLGMVANVAMHQHQRQPAPQEIRAPEPQQPLIDPNAIRETVKKIQYGGEDDAAAALTDLIAHVVSRVPQQHINMNDVINQAASRAAIVARDQVQGMTDAQIIRTEYGDIFANPQREFLAKVNVDAITARDVALGRRRAPLEIYREAGDMVRDAMNLPRPGSQEPTPEPAPQSAANVIPIRPDRDDIIARKRAAPRPTQTIDTRAPQPSAPRAPSPSEVVDQMRRARGQASTL